MRTLMILGLVALVGTVLPSAVLAGDGPVLTVTGVLIDPVVTSDPLLVLDPVQVPGDVFLQFCWTAEPGTFGAEVTDYRFGWDLANPLDPNDPGWSIALTTYPGSEVCSDSRILPAGWHDLVIQAVDALGVSSRVVLQLQSDGPLAAPQRTWGTLKAHFGASR